MLDMFGGLQIFMWTIFVIIVFGKFINYVSTESIQEAGINTEDYTFQTPLSYSQSISHVLSATSGPVSGTQAPGSACDNCAHEITVLNNGITNAKSGAELLAGDGITNAKSGAELLAGVGITKAKSIAEVLLSDGITKTKSRAKVLLSDGITKTKSRAKVLLSDGITKAKSRAELLLNNGITKAKSRTELLLNNEITNTKSRAELLNEQREITSDVEEGKLLFKEHRLNRAACPGTLKGRKEHLSGTKEKYSKKGRVIGFTKYMRTNMWNLLNPGINNRISGTSEDAVLVSSYTHYSNPSNLIRLRKRDISDTNNSQPLKKARYSKNSTSTQNKQNKTKTKVNKTSVETVARNVISETDNGDRKTFNFGASLSRPGRQVPSAVVPITSNRNIRAREEGDVIIGALFPLHKSPAMNNTYSRQCGEIWETYGIQRVEAFLMTVESINKNPLILPHIKLGWDIRDSCWYSPIALENSIDFIKDAIAGQSNINNVYPTVASATSAPSGPNGKLITSSSETVYMQLPRGNDSTASCRGQKNLKPIIGLVGPGSSESTIQVQNLLQIFNIPQIGYSATSHDLSNKNHYRYFLRVVPPDSYQAQALVDILLKCNWTYVSTIHTDGNYGLKGITEFTDLAKSKGICIAVSDGVAGTALDEEFDNILAKLLEDQNASVVVCFCDGGTVKSLFRAIKRRQMERRLLIIGSDGWGNRMDVVADVELQAAGAISIMFHSPPFKDFRPHYEMLTPHENTQNPWFNEFWEERFKCSLDKNSMRKYHKLCSGNESLAGSEEDSKLGFVVNAVTAMAYALQDMQEDRCPDSEGLCPAMEPIDGSIYLQYLQNVSFKSHSGEEIHFDEAGDPSAKYNILNYQPKLNADGSTTYDYVIIGSWETGVLKLDLQSIYWPQGPPSSNGELKGIVKSVCAEPCNWDQAQVKVNSVLCCWICTECADNAIVDNNTLCKECQLGTWPNLNKTDCEEIPIDFIYWSDTQAIVSISVGCLGVCSTLWVLIIFIRHHNTPVVKASTRELSYIILVGICLAFSSNFILVSKPAKEVCYLTRILPGLSFSLMYGALVTRTNRIARILEGSKRIMTKKPKFMSATAQVVIAFIIIGVEGAVITGMLLYQPAGSRLDYSTPKKVRLICDTSTLGIVVPLGFDLVLIILCTIYAVKTRNLPENFNEAKFIGFTMYATCVIWLGFFPIYFAGHNKEITFSISMSLSAAVALVLLFIPKVYVIVWVPENNTRGAFTTSKDVRCHIGVMAMSSGDSLDIKENSTLDALLKSDKPPGGHWRQKSLDQKRFRFVMQRTAHSEDDTPYVNHGVIPKRSNTKCTTFVNRVTKTSCKTAALAAAAAPSCPEQEKLLSEEPTVLSNAEMIRQNLARDFPLHKQSATLRPGSPAEKEKHRINNTDRVVDFGELLEKNMFHVPERMGRLGEIRKSLSSTCVSSCPDRVSVQCQTTDDLVGGLLPPLRRRCVSKNKSRLKRSNAADDVIDPTTYFRNAARNVHSIPIKRYMASSDIHESFSSRAYNDRIHSSGLEISGTTPDACHVYDNQNVFPLLDITTEESSQLGTFCEDHLHQYNVSHTVSGSCCHTHHNDIGSYSSKSSPCLSPLVLTENPQDTFEPVELPDCNFEDIHNKCDNYNSSRHSTQCETFSRHLSLHNLGYGVSFSAQNASGTSQCPRCKKSAATHQNSCSSSTISIASSSSFTLPAFHSSTDSDPSRHTFNDSLRSLELPHSNRGSQNIYSYQEDRELTDSHRNAASKPHGNKIADSNSRRPVVTFDVTEKVADDVLEFHKYLQGHGVQLELSTVQSSDL